MSETSAIDAFVREALATEMLRDLDAAGLCPLAVGDCLA